MSCSAVIFDLGGTLIDNWDFEGYTRCIQQIADMLGVGPDFTARWMDTDTSAKNLVGEISGFIPQLEYCAGAPATSFPVDTIAKTEMIYMDFSRRSLEPRESAVPVLSELRSRGYKIGLLSDCGWDVPLLWNRTPFPPLFDEAIFSCKAGMRKPDSGFFQFACDRLGIQPRDCVYVADGNSFELTAAKQLGMSPVLICVPYEREAVMQRDDPRTWQGPVIEDLSELLRMPFTCTAI